MNKSPNENRIKIRKFEIDYIVALIVSLVILFFSIYWVINSYYDCSISNWGDLQLNEKGDALAGVAGSLAIIWLIASFRVNQKEVRFYRDELKEQTKSFNHNIFISTIETRRDMLLVCLIGMYWKLPDSKTAESPSKENIWQVIEARLKNLDDQARFNLYYNNTASKFPLFDQLCNYVIQVQHFEKRMKDAGIFEELNSWLRFSDIGRVNELSKSIIQKIIEKENLADTKQPQFVQSKHWKAKKTNEGVFVEYVAR